MTKLALPILALVLALVACGGNKADPAAPATPSSSTATSTGSPEGGECGDDVAIQKKCAEGLVCAPKPNAPVSEHTPGVCKKP